MTLSDDGIADTFVSFGSGARRLAACCFMQSSAVADMSRSDVASLEIEVLSRDIERRKAAGEDASDDEAKLDQLLHAQGAP